MSEKVLISAFNLRKYFPISNSNFLSKKQDFVRANKDINIDILEGETLGLVGESGCGKSTFGRTLIQLHEQTGGATLYYGVNIFDFRPEYLKKDMMRITSIKKALLDIRAKRSKKVDKFLLVSPQRGALRFFGGILAHPNLSEAQKRLQKAYSNKESLRQVFDTLLVEAKEQSDFTFWDQYRDEGIDLSLLTKNEMRSLRKELQIIFQDPYSSLDPRHTVEDIIGEGLITMGIFKDKKSPEYKEYIYDVMEQCGLDRSFAKRYPHQFSGGQRQRIGIARAVALEPTFIVADEAVSALDVSIQSQIINLLQDLKKQRKMTYLFITHDLGVVRYISDRIGVMYFGNLVELAPAEEIFNNPQHPYTKQLLKAIPRLSDEELVFENKRDVEVDFASFEESKIPDREWVEVRPKHFVAARNLEKGDL